MKKKIQLLCILVCMITAGILLVQKEEYRGVRLNIVGNELQLVINTQTVREEKLTAWKDDVTEKRYFFVPSFVNSNIVYLSDFETMKIKIDGQEFKQGDKFRWESGKDYEISLSDIWGNNSSYELIFMQSANIPAMFIETESGSMEYIHQDKENVEGGALELITPEGNVEYSGALEKISGRGNSTWARYEKKPYSIELKTGASLCGMDKGKSWKLLACFREGAKMTTKLTLDLAKEMEMPYSVDATWVDLYLNGEFAGNYLLAESVSIGEGRVNIYDLEKENRLTSNNIEYAQTYTEDKKKGYLIDGGQNVAGGYLLEKDIINYYEEEYVGFITASGSPFSIKEPKHASKEQVDYISSYIQNIDDLIVSGDAEYWRYLDKKSFVNRFLLDEIVLNFDTSITSMYFFKDRDSEILYSGPMWDYDSALGANSEWNGGKWVDYEWSTLYPIRPDVDALNWYALLYENDDEFYNELVNNYVEFLPVLKELIDNKIDVYAETIEASVNMDAVRWEHAQTRDGFKAGHYRTFDNNVRYIKFFLSKRLNYLDERWNVECEEFEIPSNGQSHEVVIMIDDEVIDRRMVEDGNTINDLPQLDSEKFYWWEIQGKNEPYQCTLPIFEDMVLVPKKVDG